MCLYAKMCKLNICVLMGISCVCERFYDFPQQENKSISCFSKRKDDIQI